ncbi:putative ABC transporter [Triangularia verruculosa]|uniref:ABC transporter n=1 Tax=Triangularia verruculosa TaxID=2587418 RepID=A0AAN6XMJ4_9PEZI|nr:putative ABC transporter [Triangularia verruculosa]
MDPPASSPVSAACAHLDDSFGPHAGECRGGFDFTLFFEETILIIPPTGLILLVSLPRVWFMWRKAKKLTRSSHLATVKISTWIALAVLQLAALILWSRLPSPFRSRTTLAAAALTFVSSLALCSQSYVEHTRNVRPSSIINSFLLATLLFDIARARTLWLREPYAVSLDQDDDSFDINKENSLAYLAITAVVVKGFLLVIEALNKRKLLRPEYRGYGYGPEAASGIYNRSFFWWLNPLFWRGFKKGRVLDVDKRGDLPELDKHLQANYNHRRLGTAWAATVAGGTKKVKSPYALLLTAFGVLKWIVFGTIPPRAALTALMFCQPFLINRTIRLSQEPITDGSTQIGYGLIGAYSFVYVGIAVTMGQYQHKTYRTIAMVRAGLISMIYRKTSTLSLKDIDPAASMTLMSADMERIVQGWQTMHEIWSNAIEVGVAIFLLERQLGIACVVPVALSILSLLGSMVAMNFIVSRQAMWLEAIERRISATSAMLSSMKGVKMCGLKDTLMASMQKLRVDELRISKRFRKLIIWNMVFAYVTQVFAPVLTFAIFSVRARDTGDQTLDTARVFTALSLFALLSEPLASLVMSLATFLGSVGSFTRIQNFLQSDERQDPRKRDPDMSSSENSLDMALPVVDMEKPSPHAIVVEKANFGWDPEKGPILSDITMSVPWRQLTMVVGPVGCGKSVLLQSILGEIPSLSGSVHLSSTSIAYCSQSPWHMNGTIREAILGTAEYDPKWYATVLRACALGRDLKELPNGDSSRIGSGGIALSGGQSQRISLARAVYARREIVILDDVLSGLDTSTENHVFHSLLGERGIFTERKSTVLVVSSSVKRLPYAGYVVCLDPSGTVSAQGTFEELNNAGTGYVSTFSLPSRPDWNFKPEDDHFSDDDETTDVDRPKELHETDSGTSVSGSSRERISQSQSPERAPSFSSDIQSDDEADAINTLDSGRQTGDVQIYTYYIMSVGIWPTLIFVSGIVAFVFCISFPTVWVQWWAAENEIRPNDNLGYWIGLYAMFGGIAIIGLTIGCWQMIIKMVPLSGEKFHLALLKTVLSAPMSFFVKTDTGVTMNRFSQDLQLIDMELPIAALNTFTTLILCIAQMALIGVGSIYAAISFPIVLITLYLVQKFYLRTSRQIRLIDIETKAPLYSLFEESLRGIATIRAFGWQDALEKKNHTLLNRSMKPFYLMYAIQRWLTLVLDLLVAAIAVLLIILVVHLRGTVAAGGVGLALLNVIQFSQSVKLLVTFWTTLETQIGSVARIKSFTNSAVPSEDLPGEDQSPPSDWPQKGGIEIKNFTAAYNEGEAEPVLRDVTLSIAAGEKVAICGRTGSGKTCLVSSLFRMTSTHSGSISIDGIDTSTVPREDVRRRLVGVPQHPFLLKGSVRLNVDPLGQATDAQIQAALQEVKVWDMVHKLGGLGADIDSLNLSQGQKQLFCLARAIVRPGNILVLDEATSTLDGKTEEMVQRLIRRKFCDYTILAVAHRLDTIMDFDKVVVLDKGKVVEFGSPWKLVEEAGEGGMFKKLWLRSVEDDIEDVPE